MRVSAGTYRFILVLPRASVAAIPNLLPAECYTYTVNSDATRNSAYNSSTSYCDQNEFSVPKWVRFMDLAGTQLASSNPGTGRCGSQYPGYLIDTHPVRTGEKKTASVCYNYYGGCNWQSSISITNCGDYFVYYLSASPSCSARYCTV